MDAILPKRNLYDSCQYMLRTYEKNRTRRGFSTLKELLQKRTDARSAHTNSPNKGNGDGARSAQWAYARHAIGVRGPAGPTGIFFILGFFFI